MIRNFVPVFIGRGVVQISAYVDTVLASLLPTGAVAALSYAQVLYTLPVSLFGMSVSAAELPAMSRETGEDSELAAQLRTRLERGLKQIAFFVVPSAVAFLFLGDVITGALYQSGQFTRSMTVYVWGILAGSAVGLLASTLGPALRLHLLRSAGHQNPSPVRHHPRDSYGRAGVSVRHSTPDPFGLDPKWGAAGLTVSAGIAGWVEFILLRAGTQSPDRQDRNLRPADGEAVGRGRGSRYSRVARSSWVFRVSIP